MPDAKVVSIDGGPIVEPGNPDPDVVALAEQVLADARAGRTHLLVTVTMIAGRARFNITGQAELGYSAVGALEAAKAAILSELSAPERVPLTDGSE